MGCGYPPRTIEREEIFIMKSKNEKDISFLICRNLETLIEKNPFYRKKIKDFELTFNSIKEKKQKDINKIIEEVNKTFLNNEKEFVKDLFSEVVKYAVLNYNLDINNGNNHELILIIIKYIYIFLSDNQAGKKELFRKNILEILKIINKNNNEKNNECKIEKIFNLIINLVHMHSFFFETFFLYFSFFQVFKNDNDNYEKQINENSDKINYIKSYVESRIGKINEDITFDFLNFLFVSEINNKIKSCFENVNEEGFITLDENKINIISDSLYELMIINNFVKFLFFGENLGC